MNRTAGSLPGEVFADTSALYAVLASYDENHRVAARLHARGAAALLARNRGALSLVEPASLALVTELLNPARLLLRSSLSR